MRGFLGYRNFAMLDEKGEYVAKANSLWSLLDTETGKPSQVSEFISGQYGREPKLEMEYAPRKIAVPEGGVCREPVVVKKHHLDTNHHVNNQQFVDIAMDYLEEDFRVSGLRAEYKKQAFLDDVFIPYVVREEDRAIVALRNEEGVPYFVSEFKQKL
jgi:acyl-ACP thioesterase